MTDPLASWNEGPAKEAILEFVARTSETVPEVERVAVFDNDGTLWCEKPMPIQLDFILRRLGRDGGGGPVAARPSALEGGPRARLRLARQSDGGALRGGRHERRTLAAGIVAAFANITVEDFEAASDAFLRERGIPPWASVTSSAPMRRWWSSSAI